MDSDCLAIYLTLNPRDQIKALNLFYNQTIDSIIEQNYDAIPKKFDSAFYTSLMNTPSKKILIELDVDTKDKYILNKMCDICPPIKDNIYFIVETHGGYHIVYKKIDVQSSMQLIYKTFMKESMFDYIEKNRLGNDEKKKYVSVMNEPCLPVPGTFQGSFPVRFATLDQMLS